MSARYDTGRKYKSNAERQKAYRDRKRYERLKRYGYSDEQIAKFDAYNYTPRVPA